MRAGSIHTVGSLRSACPAVMASGSAASSATTTALSFNTSGSISFGYLSSFCIVRTAFRRILRPIQRALLPDVKKSGQDQDNEHQHFEKANIFSSRYTTAQ